MENFSWTCPFCSQPATITENSIHNDSTNMTIDNAHGQKMLYTKFIICPNPKCKEYTLSLQLFNSKWEKTSNRIIGRVDDWNLIPPSQAKVYPEYVPQAIRDDYKEACLIKDLSPKASATLSRRCLQGMIRDFWKVKGVNLKEEIEKIKDKVDLLTWEAIDVVRSIGNIGAHMEKDIDLIIDVDPDEAALLIELIETLIKEWYIQKHERETMLAEIKKMKNEKDVKKAAILAGSATPTLASPSLTSKG